MSVRTRSTFTRQLVMTPFISRSSRRRTAVRTVATKHRARLRIRRMTTPVPAATTVVHRAVRRTAAATPVAALTAAEARATKASLSAGHAGIDLSACPNHHFVLGPRGLFYWIAIGRSDCVIGWFLCSKTRRSWAASDCNTSPICLKVWLYSSMVNCGMVWTAFGVF